MKASSTYKKFKVTINKWESELEKYSLEDFTKKPEVNVWSIGQVYEHITSSTLNFHVKQIEYCLTHNDNANKGKTFIGWLSLFIKRIPPIEIKIPAEENIEPQQPLDKESIKEKFIYLKKLFSDLAVSIDVSKYYGKSSHPGMGYLSAAEWFEIIEMHFKYHEKDKQKLSKII